MASCRLIDGDDPARFRGKEQGGVIVDVLADEADSCLGPVVKIHGLVQTGG